ncbi:MAG TPA: helix-turn-helix transcriptional regulator [Allosphingosinicella sp.]|nr:helix-turn-helix transcriptional regulator [Allosphingosinicella sp.]
MNNENFGIAELRKELGQTLEEFAATIGIKSKGHASEIERDNRCGSVSVALTIEKLSEGRIDAASLNDDVAMARAAGAKAA